ncbi:MAG: DNA adenine methylase [Lachnospiraceae bacterium]|nr:DNA adenine methylase [Lachnospiraceae bacterium]
MNSFIPWIGGKKLLRKEICNRFPVNFNRYIEVFGGAAWVLFYKDKHAETEVYNDINSNLVNLFKCIKYHSNAIEEEMEFLLNSREFFCDSKALYNFSSLTDIQRATAYFYIIKTSYGADLRNFGMKSRDITNADFLKEVKERLKKVIIENKSYNDLIRQYDTKEALFYCDPPYYKAEKYYDTGEFTFNQEQHMNLNEMLKNIKGRCIISYNDHEFIRELYKGFNIVEIERQNGLSPNNNKYKELIIMNY